MYWDDGYCSGLVSQYGYVCEAPVLETPVSVGTLTFAGTGDYVEVNGPISSFLPPASAAEGWTMEIFVRIEAAPKKKIRLLGTTAGFNDIWINANGTVQYYRWPKISTASEISIVDGRFHHIAAVTENGRGPDPVLDGGCWRSCGLNRAWLYIDGVLEATVTLGEGCEGSTCEHGLVNMFGGWSDETFRIGSAATAHSGSQTGDGLRMSLRGFKLSAGVKFTEAFEPPRVLVNDHTTAVFLDFNEGNGSIAVDPTNVSKYAVLYGTPVWGQDVVQACAVGTYRVIGRGCVPKRSAKDCSATGWAAAPTHAYASHTNYECSGGDYSVAFRQTLSQCMALCSEEEGCCGFFYDPGRSGACQRKHGCRDCRASGIRHWFTKGERLSRWSKELSLACAGGECLGLFGLAAWHEASATCKLWGGRLATIRSKSKNEAVRAIVGAGTAYIGIREGDGSCKKQYCWVSPDGSLFGDPDLTYTAWAPGEPSFVGCGFINATTGLWGADGDDCNFHLQRRFVCERPATALKTTVTTSTFTTTATTAVTTTAPRYVWVRRPNANVDVTYGGCQSTRSDTATCDASCVGQKVFIAKEKRGSKTLEHKSVGSDTHHSGIRSEVVGARGFAASLLGQGAQLVFTGAVKCGGDEIVTVSVEVYECMSVISSTTSSTAITAATATTTAVSIPPSIATPFTRADDTTTIADTASSTAVDRVLLDPGANVALSVRASNKGTLTVIYLKKGGYLFDSGEDRFDLIGQSIVIRGSGMGETTIDAKGRRLFFIGLDSDIELYDLTLTNGKIGSTGNGNGGLIYVAGGRLHAERCKFGNSRARQNGGAIMLHSGTAIVTSFTASASVFESNYGDSGRDDVTVSDNAEFRSCGGSGDVAIRKISPTAKFISDDSLCPATTTCRSSWPGCVAACPLSGSEWFECTAACMRWTVLQDMARFPGQDSALNPISKFSSQCNAWSTSHNNYAADCRAGCALAADATYGLAGCYTGCAGRGHVDYRISCMGMCMWSAVATRFSAGWRDGDNNMWPTVGSQLGSLDAFVDCQSFCEQKLPAGNGGRDGCSHVCIEAFNASMWSVDVNKGPAPENKLVSDASHCVKLCTGRFGVWINRPSVQTDGNKQGCVAACHFMFSPICGEADSILDSSTAPAATTNAAATPFTRMECSTCPACDGAAHVKIPDGSTSIEASAFQHCPTLVSVVIPDGVSKIENSAFWGCTRLVSVHIPAEVSSIGSRALQSCYGFGLAVSGASTRGMVHCLACTDDGNLVIPKNVTRIDDNSFYDFGCQSLGSVVIGDGVTSIGEYAFYKGSMAMLVIGDRVASIGGWAFSHCHNLASVVIPRSVINIGEHAFDECTSLASLVIPDREMWIGTLAFYNMKCCPSSDCGYGAGIQVCNCVIGSACITMTTTTTTPMFECGDSLLDQGCYQDRTGPNVDMLTARLQQYGDDAPSGPALCEIGGGDSTYDVYFTNSDDCSRAATILSREAQINFRCQREEKKGVFLKGCSSASVADSLNHWIEITTSTR